MILYAVINGYLDSIEVSKVTTFEADFHRFIEVNHAEIGRAIAETKELDEKTEEALKKAIEEFKKEFSS